MRACTTRLCKRSPAAALALALVVWWGCGVAAAQQNADDDACEPGASLGQGDALEVRPPDGAEGVARDAPIIVRYEQPEELDALIALLEEDTSAACSELVCLFRDDGDGSGGELERIAGDVRRVDDSTLVFTPERALAADTRHFALVARPGFDRLTRTELLFETGDGRDEDPPELFVDRLTLEIETLPDHCPEPDGSVRVGVALPRAQDDGDEESVELLLYLTRAVGLMGPELRARGLNGSAVALTFLLSPEQARDTICLALRAVDGVGRVAEYDEEVCFHPGDGGVFQAGCGAGVVGAGPGLRAPGARVVLAWAAILVLLWSMRTRRSSPSRRRPGAVRRAA